MSRKKYRAVSDRVLVEVDEIKEKTSAGGIIIETKYDANLKTHRCDVGVILDIGPTAFDNTGFQEKEVKIGDRIKFVQYGGRSVADPNDPLNNRLRVIKIDDIYCVEELENE